MDQHVAGHLERKQIFFYSIRKQDVNLLTSQGKGEAADVPLRLKYSAEYLPDRATAGGILPSSCMIWAIWSEMDGNNMHENHNTVCIIIKNYNAATV